MVEVQGVNPLLQALFVGLFVQMQPDLHDDHAGKGEAVLKALEFVDKGVVLALTDFTHAVPVQKGAVPAVEEEGCFALAGQTAPEAPFKGPLPLLVRLPPEHVVGEELSVHPFGYLVHDLAATCAFKAADYDEQGDFLLPAGLLRLEDLHAQHGFVLIVFLSGAAPAQYDCVEHLYLPGCRRAPPFRSRFFPCSGVCENRQKVWKKSRACARVGLSGFWDELDRGRARH